MACKEVNGTIVLSPTKDAMGPTFTSPMNKSITTGTRSSKSSTISSMVPAPRACTHPKPDDSMTGSRGACFAGPVSVRHARVVIVFVIAAAAPCTAKDEPAVAAIIVCLDPSKLRCPPPPRCLSQPLPELVDRPRTPLGTHTLRIVVPAVNNNTLI